MSRNPFKIKQNKDSIKNISSGRMPELREVVWDQERYEEEIKKFEEEKDRSS
mgnify:CR=1 FL=1